MTLLDDMLALLPDNFTGEISAADMRTIVTDLYNLSIANGGGGPFQPLDSDLTTIAGLTATTDNIIQSVSGAWASRTPAQVKAALAIAESDVTNLVSDLAGKQPLDSDLTTIAGLTATTDNFIQSKSSAWSSRTPAQVAADLQGLVTVAESQVTNLVSDLAAKAPIASPTFTGTVTLPGDPASALQAATKQYVDALGVTVGKRYTVRAATTANITISTALNNASVLDGVTLATGDLVLVKDQSTAAQNGIYVVGASPARSTEYDTYNEHPGAIIVVQEGTANADSIWFCTSNAGGTLNTTAIVFAKTTATGALLASNNLSDVANAATALSNLGGQPLDSDLTTIAGLTATTDNFLQAKSSAWASRTPAQVATDLQAAGLAPLASPALTGSATAVNLTLSGKFAVTPDTLTDAATIATDASLGNHFRVTLGGNRTLGNPTNAIDGQKIMFELIQDATGTRTITLDTKFALGTDISAVTLTTTASKRDFLGVVYNSTADKFYVIAFVKGY